MRVPSFGNSGEFLPPNVSCCPSRQSPCLTHSRARQMRHLQRWRDGDVEIVHHASLQMRHVSTRAEHGIFHIMFSVRTRCLSLLQCHHGTTLQTFSGFPHNVRAAMTENSDMLDCMICLHSSACRDEMYRLVPEAAFSPYHHNPSFI